MSQLKNAYNAIILDLWDEDHKLDIPRRLIENMLAVEIGAAKPATLERHIRIMLDLGYLSLAAHGYGPESMRYDLVAKKVKSVRANMAKVVK